MARRHKAHLGPPAVTRVRVPDVQKRRSMSRAECLAEIGRQCSLFAGLGAEQPRALRGSKGK